MKTPCFRSVINSCLGLLLAWGVDSLHGAPIPGLFNTGVDDQGAPLGNATKDPHYRLIGSADPAAPGPDTFTLEPGFPVPPWIAESTVSRWIAPSARQGTGNLPGDYVFRTTFDLTGFDSAKAKIVGRWTSDNAGVDILLNDVSLGIVQGGNFAAFTDFTIDFGFIDGVNTLDFVINNAGDAVNPAGLRVEMIGTVEIAGEKPRLVTNPVGGTFLVGDPVTLSAVADGTPPLTYQWRRNGSDLGGATEPTLTIDGITVAQAGEYTVVVRNAVGETPSEAATVRVLDLIPGLFNTGVDNDGNVLWDGLTDPHYQLVANPDDVTVTEPLVQDSTLFPIVSGPWIANSDTSVWIGPRLETSAAAGGDYVYELEVDLTGFDASTAFISGLWATDNSATLLLNDAPTGLSNTGNFDTLTPFRLEGVLLSGKNKLQFKVNNASEGYTGLRVQGIRGGAQKGAVGDAPRILSQPVGGLLLTGESIVLSVLADGAKPLSYRWRKNGTDLTGQSTAQLSLGPVTRGDAGDYTVVVSNAAGSLTSAAATVTVLERVSGIFGTGVGADGVVLADGEVDPHYKLVVNATDPSSQDAIVHDSTVFPIVTGPWVANTDRSKWIAPLLDSGGASGGDYAYRTSIDLSGFDPATVVLMGGWATDNLGTDIKLNNQSTGLQNGTQFGSLTPFTISAGFVTGVNTLEFQLNNADAVTGYTGLRVDNLRAGGLPLAGPAPSLTVEHSGSDVVVSWPDSATGYKLVGSAVVGTGAAWTDVATPPTSGGGRLSVKIAPTAAQQFFQLQK